MALFQVAMLNLTEWVIKAGIEKHITFHCARHTYATLQITLGTDIFTVSKLLGHRHLKTTEIYAKVIDQKKQEQQTKSKLIYSNGNKNFK